MRLFEGCSLRVEAYGVAGPDRSRPQLAATPTGWWVFSGRLGLRSTFGPLAGLNTSEIRSAVDLVETDTGKPVSHGPGFLESNIGHGHSVVATEALEFLIGAGALCEKNPHEPGFRR